jgi:hypothetical protein
MRFRKFVERPQKAVVLTLQSTEASANNKELLQPRFGELAGVLVFPGLGFGHARRG